mmetsp:Transcript_18714/g.29974  ORF Transcript_18714/g.29974 Transcript_18714/m.29974 type:complete len:212 (-) Transcript_18714:1252-1887(-)
MSPSVTSSLVISPCPLLMLMISASVLTYSTFAFATSSMSSDASLSALAASASANAHAAATALMPASSPAAAALALAASTFFKFAAACVCLARALARRRSPKDSSAEARLWSRPAFCSRSSSVPIFFCFARSLASSSCSAARHAAAIFPPLPGLYFSSASFALIWSRSLTSCATLRSTTSKSSGLSVFCMRTAAEASSSRSMALSGRQRPET